MKSTCQLISSLAIVGSLLVLSACGKPKMECEKEKCSGKVTLAEVDFSTAKCEANGVACEFAMPANRTYGPHDVSATACSKKNECGDGNTCSAALSQTIANNKFDLENSRTTLLSGVNNRCVVAPSPNQFPCSFTPPQTPDAVYEPDTPKEAVCTGKKCFCPR